jgi:hypothetical protein
MQIGRAPGPGRDLVVGPDRLVAARIFGPSIDGGHVTSFADLDAETDLATVRSLCVVAAAETADLLGAITTTGHRPEQIVLGAADDAAGRDALLLTLGACPDLRPDTWERDGRAIVVRLVPADAAVRSVASKVARDLRRLHADPSRTMRSRARRAVSRLRS